jgi:hypothetical protein
MQIDVIHDTTGVVREVNRRHEHDPAIDHTHTRFSENIRQSMPKPRTQNCKAFLKDAVEGLGGSQTTFAKVQERGVKGTYR